MTARRFIQYVSDGMAGTWNDSSTVKYTEAVTSLQPTGTSWLRSVRWKTIGTEDDPGDSFQGCYFICDGGYLRWQSLVSPYEVPSLSHLEYYRGVLAAVRKDSECTFGSLKRKFRSLKGWSSFKYIHEIQSHFIFCCIIHNIMLRTNGFLDDEQYEVPGGVMEKVRRRFRKYNTDCDGCFMRATLHPERSMTAAEVDGYEQDQEWKRRVLAISKHQYYLRLKSKTK